MKIMAIDYGDAHTGIAISDFTCTLAGYTTVINSRKAERAGKRAKNLLNLIKKLLTCGCFYAIIDITCEWGFLFCALFRFERAKKRLTIREAAGTFVRKVERCLI